LSVYLNFARRVFREFSHNRGLLLASGVGYNVLLSMIPMLAVIAAVTSEVVSEEHLLFVITNQARLIVPGQATYIANTVASMVDNRHLVGGVGLVVALVFSSLAFRMLDDAMAIIFHRHARTRQRRPWVTFLLPYAFVLALGIALLILTGLFVVLDGLARLEYVMLGIHLSMSVAAVFALWAAGFLGVAMLFTSIYKVMPMVHIPF
jgi:YihY family inner membrane protein